MIVEILERRTARWARRPDLELFAKSHGLKIGTIAGTSFGIAEE